MQEFSTAQTPSMPMGTVSTVTCGLDVHKDKIDACILINDGTEEGNAVFKVFSTMRGSLIELVSWIRSFNCRNVLMESTGVFWMPIYFLLEAVDNMNVGLGNSYHMKNAPGRRKTDKDDSKWIAKEALNINVAFLCRQY